MRLRSLLALSAVAAAGYFALFGGEYSLFEVWRLERQTARESAELEQVRRDVERLRARADSLASDSATLERIARERYGLIRDGERLYRFVDETGETDPRPAPARAATDPGTS